MDALIAEMGCMLYLSFVREHVSISYAPNYLLARSIDSLGDSSMHAHLSNASLFKNALPVQE